MKRLLLIMILATVLGSVSAQESVRYDDTQVRFDQTQGTYDRVTQRGPYLTNRFFDNIFFGVAGGVNLYMGEGDSKGAFGKRLAPAVELSLGKWITPSVGLRLQYTGIQAKGFSTVQTVYTNDVADKDGLFTKKFNMMNAHADVLWNLSNAIGGYNETRTWDFIPFAGFGVARSAKNSNTNVQLSGNVGLLNKIRLGNVVDLTLEAKYMIVKPEFDKFVGNKKFDGMASLTAGISIKFGPTRGFKRPITPDYTPYTRRITTLESDLSQSQRLAAENKTKVDNLNRELEAARNRPAPAPETVVVKVSAPASMTIFFKIGSYAVSEKDMVNLSNIADYINESPEKTFKVVGYADSSTGSVATNERLSRRRAQSVADALVEKFGVKRSQLTVDHKGGVSYDANPTLSRMVKIE